MRPRAVASRGSNRSGNRTRRRPARLAIAALLGGLLHAGAPGQDSDAAKPLAGLQAWLDGTRQLEARFEQTLLSGVLGTGLSESGRLYLQRPGRMRWEYLDPERKTALLDGDEVQLYLEEDQQLIRSRLDEHGDLLPKLLLGEGRLSELFDVSVLSTPGTDDRGLYRVRLVPRERSESFEEVSLSLRPRSFAIREALVLDAAGNEIEYRFSALRRNRALPDGIFVFEPPPGTEIIHY